MISDIFKMLLKQNQKVPRATCYPNRFSDVTANSQKKNKNIAFCPEGNISHSVCTPLSTAEDNNTTRRYHKQPSPLFSLFKNCNKKLLTSIVRGKMWLHDETILLLLRPIKIRSCLTWAYRDRKNNGNVTGSPLVGECTIFKGQKIHGISRLKCSAEETNIKIFKKKR